MDYHSMSELIPFHELPDATNKYELGELLGTGTYGRVFKGTCKSTGNPVAIKVVSHIPEHIVEIEAEYTSYFAIAGQTRHFPAFHGTFLRRTSSGTDDEVWFVIELLSGCTVANVLDKIREDGSSLNEEQIAYILRKVLQALNYLHKKKVIHRDIRSANLMLTDDGSIKVFDFGLSTVLFDAENAVFSSAVGSPYWIAPEVIASEQQNTSYDILCDIWSLGILAIELADTRPPLHPLHPVRAMFQIVRNPPPHVVKSKDWSESFRDFISECLIKNPEHRSVAEELLEHPFITKVVMDDQTVSKELQCLVASIPSSFYCRDTPHDVTVKDGYLKQIANGPFEKMYVEDLASLENPTEESLVEHLNQRFQLGSIYTYIGDILLAVNPFQELPLYGSDIASMYCEKARSDNAPHVYAIADRAYQDMQHHKRRQVILLNGPSGTGKTRSMKHIIEHLVYLGESYRSAMNDKIRLLCPLLDALGNASTCKHRDASRFVKSIEVTFTKTGRLTGAVISTFLLETLRVADVPSGEKNFHIFYYIFHGLKADGHLTDFELEDGVQYRCLPKLNEQANKDVEGYRRFSEALKSLSFTEEEVRTILRILSAIILLGELKFDTSATWSTISNPETIARVSKLLGLNQGKLEEALTSNKSVEEAGRCRNSYMSSLYSALTEWILSLINRQLSFSRLVLGGAYSVCVVDPPGFENVTSDTDPNKRNGLWQLCFNVLHDNLVNAFHRHLFTRELEEYSEEEVAVPFQAENVQEHDAFLKKVLAGGHKLLSSICECTAHYCQDNNKWKEQFINLLKKEEVAGFADFNNEIVEFQHVYEKVCYNVRDLLEHNARSAYQPSMNIKAILESSGHSIISTLLSEVWKHEKTGSSPFKLKLTASAVKRSAAEIAELSIPRIVDLEASESPQVVVCVKPNSDNQPQTFDKELVLKEMRYMKILEATFMRKLGYSTRLRYDEFLERYKFLAFDFDEVVNLDKTSSRLLMVRLKMDGWELGKTKIFLKYYTEEYLTRFYEVHVKMIVKVQSLARRFIIRCRAKKNSSG